MGDADLLAVSLSELERTGWNLDNYLNTRKDLSDSVTLSLLAANRIRRAPRPVPSHAFRSRARRSFVTLVQEQAVSRLTTSPPTFAQRARRLLIGPILVPLAAMFLAMSGAGVGFVSRTALPESPVYSVKIGIERLEGLAAVTPTEQAEVRLRTAASRLAEADVELNAGNALVARELLGQVDAEIAGAYAIVAAHGLENSSLVTLGRQLATLGSTRDRVSARVEPTRSVADSSVHPGPDASDSANLGGATAPSVDPTLSPTGAAAIVERAKPLSPGATVVASASTTQSSKVGMDARAALIDRSLRLSRLLIVQVESGDGESATATARDFAEVTHELSASENGVTELLRQERISFVACLATASPSTRVPLRVALNSIDDVLGGVAEKSTSNTAGKVPTSGRIAMVVSATPVPVTSTVGLRSRNKTERPNQSLPAPAKASITLPGFLGIGVLLGPPPVAPPSTASPEEARPLSHEARRSLPADWHATRTMSPKPLRASVHPAKKPIGHHTGRPFHPKPPGNVGRAHSAPRQPTESSTGSLKLPLFGR